MNKENIKQEESNGFALEDVMVEGVQGGSCGQCRQWMFQAGPLKGKSGESYTINWDEIDGPFDVCIMYTWTVVRTFPGQYQARKWIQYYG